MAKAVSRRAFTAMTGSLGLSGSITSAMAQDIGFAGKTMKIVVPFPAGGATDIIARLVGERLGSMWGAPLIVENVPGAGANIGNDRVAKGALDGTHLLMISLSVATNQYLYARLPYDPEKDFAPLCQVVSVPNLLCVRKELPVNSVPELVAYARANPGKLNYSSSGIGSSPHLSAELFKKLAGVDIVHVPYSGAAPALNDLLSGGIDLTFGTIPSIIAHARAGSVKAIGISTAKRAPSALEYPAIAETVAGYDSTSWYGLAVRAGTPKNIRDKIERDARAMCRDIGVREKFSALASETIGSSAEEFANYIATERVKWGMLIRDLGIRVD